MRCYILVGASSKGIEGGWNQVICIAKRALDSNPDLILKIYLVRGGEKWATVVAEVTRGGLMLMRGGNRSKVRNLLRVR